MQHRTFLVEGPTIWNGFHLQLRLLSKNSSPTFLYLPESGFVSHGWAGRLILGGRPTLFRG